MPWWETPLPALLQRLQAGEAGLGQDQAAARLAAHGPNSIARVAVATPLRLLARQFASPLVLILAAGAVISLALRDWSDAGTILVIVACSAGLGFWQEWRASQALGRLRNQLALTVQARRDGQVRRVPATELVPGDVIELSAGNLVPADGVLLQARDFLVSQAGLTGESFPVEKQPGPPLPGAALAQRHHAAFLGSSVCSGTATLLVTATGADTVMAGIAQRLGAAQEETEFERGVRRFGELLLKLMFAVVLAVLVVNQALQRPLVESAMFAIALAVGLSPELLPAIVSVSLARGARLLAAQGVMVRRLDAIEDLGGMDTLCTDKTGTLTEGRMTLAFATDATGEDSPRVLRAAWLNASFETGIDNPIDAALVQAGQAAGLSTQGCRKIDEIPYDFARRRLTVAVALDEDPSRHLLVTKGAFAQVLAACDRVLDGEAERPLDAAGRERLEARLRRHAECGIRVLAVAWDRRGARPRWDVADEAGLVFAGFLGFVDPPKAQAAATVRDLAARGVRVKMVTGDNRHVAAHVAQQVGLDASALLTGEAIAALRDEALWHLAGRTDVFAEVDPMQKERIVRALQRTGHAVGYMGDGINDAPALHAADVGISVDGAVDVARDSADIVLLAPDLDVLRRGVEQGRRTFANTLKYIRITTSANFGNMVSMALATPLLPFLPLTATQILLNNFLSDLPALALAADSVDDAELAGAQRWDLAGVRRFMLAFGLLSSVFDLLAFVLLRRVFDAGQLAFHSGWFVLSVLTEVAVMLVLRTQLPSWRSRPGRLLAGLSVAVAAGTVALPFLPGIAPRLGLAPMSAALVGAMLGIVVAYAAATETLKRWFFGTAG